LARPRKKKVYVDSSVLGHWLLYHKAKKSEIAEAPKRVSNSLLLLDQIKQGWFSCKFETSDFTFAELYQVLRDNIIANKIVKDAQSLVYFKELKEGYRLNEDEIEDLDYYLDEFNDLLKELKVAAYIMTVDMHDVQDFIVDLNLSTPDALHLAWADSFDPPYDYFVTSDRDFLDFENAINSYLRTTKIVRPSGLHLIPDIRTKKRTGKSWL